MRSLAIGMAVSQPWADSMKARILFVDDERLVLDGLRRSLDDRRDRWDMAFVDTPGGALAAMDAAPFDVVVSDVSMPGMTGIAMIETMRQSHERARYLLLTGAADLSVAVDAINRAGIFRFLVKPCAKGLLIEAIEAALNDKASASVGEAALARLSVGVVVVDASAKVLFANQVGARLMREGDGLSLGSDGICRAGIPARTQALRDLVAAAVTTGEGGVMSLNRRDGLRPLALAVCGTGPNATLYVNDPDQTPLPSPAELGKLLALTPAEARLSHALASGAALEEAAMTCGITVGTARAYLKQIFLKTGTQRQADLVRLILGQPAILA